MASLESLTFRLAQSADLRTVFAADPDAALAAWDPGQDDTHRASLHRLCSPLAFPAPSLLQQLLGDGPDDPGDPRHWTMPLASRLAPSRE